MRLAIRSDAVVLKYGKILLNGSSLVGDWIKIGEDAEEVCKRKAKKAGQDLELIKPLHPMIIWGMDEEGKKSVIVNLSYLAKSKGEENGR